jgi:hypothetical protein
MFNSKLTTKLLFVLLFLLLAGSVPELTLGKTVMGICFNSCDALDAACNAAGGSADPVACLDIIPISAHVCAGLSPTNPQAYVNECTSQGGVVSGSSGGAATCTKICL